MGNGRPFCRTIDPSHQTACSVLAQPRDDESDDPARRVAGNVWCACDPGTISLRLACWYRQSPWNSGRGTLAEEQIFVINPRQCGRRQKEGVAVVAYDRQIGVCWEEQRERCGMASLASSPTPPSRAGKGEEPNPPCD